MWQITEQLFLQILITQLEAETFEKIILHWLDRPYIMPGHTTVLLPQKGRVQVYLRPIITDSPMGLAVISGSSSPAGRCPASNVSATSARHAQL